MSTSRNIDAHYYYLMKFALPAIELIYFAKKVEGALIAIRLQFNFRLPASTSEPATFLHLLVR